MFSRKYTAEDLDRGCGMIWHPLTKHSMAEVLEMRFDEDRQEYYFLRCMGFADGYIGFEPVPMREYLGKIGDGKSHARGSPYPKHWKFDPFTCQELSRLQSSGQSVKLCCSLDEISYESSESSPFIIIKGAGSQKACIIPIHSGEHREFVEENYPVLKGGDEIISPKAVKVKGSGPVTIFKVGIIDCITKCFDNGRTHSVRLFIIDEEHAGVAIVEMHLFGLVNTSPN